jgi:hypothetical protein
MGRFSLDIEDYTDPLLCNAWVATAIVGSAIIGAGTSIYASGEAADAQTEANQRGIDAQQRMYNQTRSDLTPYRVAGEDNLKELNARMPELTAPIELTQDWLESTPGYQFTKTQGLKSVQNSAAARGLGASGAALKGAATFATGLADNTYKTQFDVANINKTNAYNRLKSLVDTGQSAAAQIATAGTSAANAISNLSTGQGNAQAAAWNAAGGAIGNAANNIGGYVAYRGLYGGSGNNSYSNPPTGNEWYNT